jgi:hypothetical protein
MPPTKTVSVDPSAAAGDLARLLVALVRSVASVLIVLWMWSLFAPGYPAVCRVRTHQTRPSPPVAIYAEPTLRWLSRPRQIAAIVCLVLALVALVFELTFEFWVLIAASLAIWAFDLWEKRRLGR